MVVTDPDWLNVAAFASGRGTDFQSLIDANERGDLAVNLRVLIVNYYDAGAIARAEKHGIEWLFIDHRKRTREDFERELIAELDAREIGLVVLAGFMRLLSPLFVGHYKDRIINIHPALLPSFPGAHAHRDTLAYGVKLSGCTIHFVDEKEDHGPIIIQKAVDVLPGDTEETLALRILAEEHKLLPKVVGLFAAGKLVIEGRRVTILD